MRANKYNNGNCFMCALFTRQHLANVSFTSHFYVTMVLSSLTEHPQIKPNCPLFKVKWFAFIFCTCLQEISCTALSCQCAQIAWWCPNRFKTDETLGHFLQTAKKIKVLEDEKAHIRILVIVILPTPFVPTQHSSWASNWLNKAWHQTEPGAFKSIWWWTWTQSRPV